VPGMREQLDGVPVVAVSPFVDGRVLKGPTIPCLRAAGVTPDLTGTLALYGEAVDGVVADERAGDLPVLVTDVLMDDAASRARLARETLQFAAGLK
jgi:LPPG:FO 2-phospho-L-lactate transferase